MRNARELLLAYCATIADPDATAVLFTDDGVIELPYLTPIGVVVDHQALRIRGDDDIPPSVGGRCELRGRVVQVPDERPYPARCGQMVAGLEGHRHVPLDVLEHMPPKIVEPEAARRPFVPDLVEVAKQSVH